MSHSNAPSPFSSDFISMEGSTCATAADVPVVTVRKGTAADLGPMSRVLAKAFADDPVVNWLVRGDDKHNDAMEYFFYFCAKYLTLPYGEVWTCAGNEGAVLWAPPRKWKLGPVEQLSHLGKFIRMGGLNHLPRFLSCAAAMDIAHPEQDHYYLFEIGVDPMLRGRGIGNKLMDPVLTQCDRLGLPAYLENTNAANQRFYEKLGFVTTRELNLGKNAPPCRTMWREPRCGKTDHSE